MVFAIMFWAAVVVATLVATVRGLSRSPRYNPRQQAAEAARRVDDLFDQARIRMEEAAGRRRPGEQRIGDGIRGSWRSW